jgi:hypothetical protein
MTMTSNKRHGWQGFLETIDLVTASALADLEAGAEPKRRWRRTFQVELLAAASGDGVELPETGILSEGSELGVTITPEDRRLIVRLQLQGFATLDQFGGREARLVSDNGAIDYRFTFAHSGSAVCILADDSRVREGLCKCAVFFAEEGLSGAADEAGR